MEFEAGTIVSLKSGGPPLTVVEVEGEQARCIWFAQSDDRLQEARIPLACLEAVDDEEDEDEDEEDEEDEDDEEEG
jgi:uncharacterized protein YodC (DUF2158 family)